MYMVFIIQTRRKITTEETQRGWLKCGLMITKSTTTHIARNYLYVHNAAETTSNSNTFRLEETTISMKFVVIKCLKL